MVMSETNNKLSTILSAVSGKKKASVEEARAVYESRPWVSQYPNEMHADISVDTEQNLLSLLNNRCKEYGDKDAFRLCLPNGDVGGLTFAELDKYSSQLANYFHYELDFGPGDRVAINLPNCLAYPVVTMAIWKAGCVVVNMNPLLTESELNVVLKDSQASALIIFSQFRGKLDSAILDTDVRHVFEADVADFLPTLQKLKIRAYSAITGANSKSSIDTTPLTAAVDAGEKLRKTKGSISSDVGGLARQDELAVLQYTGGTSGASKGAMLSHGNLLANLAQGTELLGQRHVGIRAMLMALPIYHIYAFGLMLGGIAWGSTGVLIPNPRPVSVLKIAFESYKFDLFAGVNTLFVKLMEEEWFVRNPCSDIRIVFAGGAALQDSVAQTWMKVVGSEIHQGYGLSECSPGVTANIPTAKIKRGTVGVPLPGTEVRLVDEHNEDVPVGERGELLVRGPQVMQAYWQAPEATAKVMSEDGWFATGDVAVMDSEGFFEIVDRIDDMILVSGFNVYPNEIEQIIAKHPDVVDVGVVGIADDNTGNAVWAFVVPRTDQLHEDAVRAHARQHLTNYKVPSKIVFCEELPLSNVGKVLRRKLRLLAEQMPKI